MGRFNDDAVEDHRQDREHQTVADVVYTNNSHYQYDDRSGRLVETGDDRGSR